MSVPGYVSVFVCSESDCVESRNFDLGDFVEWSQFIEFVREKLADEWILKIIPFSLD